MPHPVGGRARYGLLALALTTFGCPAQAQGNGCDVLSSGQTDVPSLSSAVTPENLLELRDIGSLRSYPDARALAISPDARQIAFQMRRADPASNSYCLAMVVLDLRDGATPRIVDRGGALIRISSDFQDMADFPSGVSRVITPRWSSDGRWIAFLKRSQGLTQVWRSNADGSGSRQISHSAVDVRDFRIDPHGKAIIYESRPDQRAVEEALDREALSGYHYDDRFSPISRSRPRPRPVPSSYVTVDVESGEERQATEQERRALAGSPTDTPPARSTVARSKSGQTAWTEANGDLLPLTRLYASTRTQARVACADVHCTSVGGSVWWSPDSRYVIFTRREGWAQSATGFYRWRPGEKRPTRLFQTQDIISDCVQGPGDLICLRESSTGPRRIVSLNPATGQDRLLFNPNPDFARFSMPHVERMELSNPFGIEAFADFVYPNDYRPGQSYPLIVVQYQSRGFLRGGTGDETPILALAARGYAVLSFDRPLVYGFHFREGATSYDEMDRRSVKDLIDRRSVLASLDGAIDSLVRRGIVDAHRIGITGLSDGASAVQYAALNSSKFAAGVMSNCCWEPTQSGVHGPRIGDQFRRTGWPAIIEPAEAFWSRLSFIRNSARVAFPILMQIADVEYLSALEPFDALKASGKPVDLFVFPDEHHIKWQPAHRLAIYRRTIAWFDFWLKDSPAEKSLMPADAARWEAMRDAAKNRAGP